MRPSAPGRPRPPVPPTPPPWPVTEDLYEPNQRPITVASDRESVKLHPQVSSKGHAGKASGKSSKSWFGGGSENSHGTSHGSKTVEVDVDALFEQAFEAGKLSKTDRGTGSSEKRRVPPPPPAPPRMDDGFIPLSDQKCSAPFDRGWNGCDRGWKKSDRRWNGSDSDARGVNDEYGTGEFARLMEDHLGEKKRRIANERNFDDSYGGWNRNDSWSSGWARSPPPQQPVVVAPPSRGQVNKVVPQTVPPPLRSPPPPPPAPTANGQPYSDDHEWRRDSWRDRQHDKTESWNRDRLGSSSWGRARHEQEQSGWGEAEKIQEDSQWSPAEYEFIDSAISLSGIPTPPVAQLAIMDDERSTTLPEKRSRDESCDEARSKYLRTEDGTRYLRTGDSKGKGKKGKHKIFIFGRDLTGHGQDGGRPRFLSHKRMRDKGILSEWFCQVCNKECWRQEKYEEHVREKHVTCPEPGCGYSAPSFIMSVHKWKHIKGSAGESLLDDPAEIDKWRASRRANFPSKPNLERKEKEKQALERQGALPENNESARDALGRSHLERLLRRTRYHGYDEDDAEVDEDFDYRPKGKGKTKGKGKLGKGKWNFGKGKTDKGKGKGKFGKGKFDKGKGKGKGKFGKGTGMSKGKSKGGQGRLKALVWEEPTSKGLETLPSMVANQVPLEAPFAAPRLRRKKTRQCDFFARGHCHHGVHCQFRHGPEDNGLFAEPAGGLGKERKQHFWLMPSMLANVVVLADKGSTGEGCLPSGGRRPKGRHLKAVTLYQRQCEERERRDGLLRRLLHPEVQDYYSGVLQCIRYIVATDFLRLPEPPQIEDESFAGEGAASVAASVADFEEEIEDVDLDDGDIIELAEIARRAQD